MNDKIYINIEEEWSKLTPYQPGILSLPSEMKAFVIDYTDRYWFSGWGNGYVEIPKDHELFEKHHDDISIMVHGGLTFSKFLDDRWVIGFDTNHVGDEYMCSEEIVVRELIQLVINICNKNYTIHRRVDEDQN